LATPQIRRSKNKERRARAGWEFHSPINDLGQHVHTLKKLKFCKICQSCLF